MDAEPQVWALLQGDQTATSVEVGHIRFLSLQEVVIPDKRLHTHFGHCIAFPPTVNLPALPLRHGRAPGVS